MRVYPTIIPTKRGLALAWQHGASSDRSFPILAERTLIMLVKFLISIAPIYIQHPPPPFNSHSQSSDALYQEPIEEESPDRSHSPLAASPFAVTVFSFDHYVVSQSHTQPAKASGFYDYNSPRLESHNSVPQLFDFLLNLNAISCTANSQLPHRTLPGLLPLTGEESRRTRPQQPSLNYEPFRPP